MQAECQQPRTTRTGCRQELHSAAATAILITIIIIKYQRSFKSNIPVTKTAGNSLFETIIPIRLVFILQGTPVLWPTRPLGLGTWEEVTTATASGDLPFLGGWERPHGLLLHSFSQKLEVMAKHFPKLPGR